MSKHPTPDMLTDSRQAATLGKLLVESNQFPDVGGPAEVAVKILAGKELGMGPVQAVGSLQLVKGKIVLEPSMMASLIQRSNRYGCRVTQPQPITRRETYRCCW